MEEGRVERLEKVRFEVEPEFWIKYLEGNQEARDYIQNRVLPYVLGRSWKEIDTFLEGFYEVQGLKGAFKQKLGQRLSAKNLEKVFEILDKHPIASFISEENSKLAVLYDLGFIKTKEDLNSQYIRSILEDYEKWKEGKNWVENIKTWAFGGVGSGFLIEALAKNPKTKAIGRAISFVAGVVNLAGNLSELPNSDFDISRKEDIWRIIEMVGSGIGVARGFVKIKNPLFQPKLEEFGARDWRITPIVKGIEEWDELTNKLVRQAQSDLKPIDFLRLDVELPGVDRYLLSLTRYRDFINQVEGILDDEKIMKEFIDIAIQKKSFKDASDKLKSFLSVVSEETTFEALKRNYEKGRVFRILDNEGKKVADETSIEKVLRMYNESESGLKIQVVKKVKRGKEEVEEIVRELTLTKPYLPTFARNVLVKGRKGNEIHTYILDEIDIENGFLEKLIEEGVEIIGVSGGSLSVFETRRFASSVRNLFEKLLREGKYENVEDLAKAFHQNLTHYIAEMKKVREVWGLRKKTDLGFLEKIAKKKYEELDEEELMVLMKHFILKNIKTKAYPIELVRMRNLLENLENIGALGTKGKYMQAIIKEIERPLEIPFLTEFNNFFRKMWLLGNIPVRIMNTLSTLFLPLQRVFASPQLTLAEKRTLMGKIIKEGLEAMWKESGIRFSSLKEGAETTVVDILSDAIKAPFEDTIEAVLDRWGRVKFKERSLLSWAFPDVPADEVRNVVKAMWFADVGVGRPLFLYSKLGRYVGELSAFFSANYIPFYFTAKSLYQPFSRLITGKGKTGELLASFLAVMTLGGLYGTLMGFTNYPVIDFVDKGINAGIMLWDLFFEDTKIPLTDISPSMYLLSSFIADLGLGDGAGRLMTNVLMGSGLIGYFTGMRTKAGALTVPTLFDAPILQIAGDFIQSYETIKKRIKDDPQNIRVYESVILDVLSRNSGLATRIKNEFFDNFNSLMYMPRQDFVRGVKRVLFPSEYFVEPAMGGFYNKQGITMIREGGINGIVYFLGQVKKGVEKGGKTYQLEKQMEKALETVLKKKPEEIDMDDVKNFVFTAMLLKKLKGVEVDLSEDEINKISRKLVVPPEQIIAYKDDLRRKIKIASAIAEKWEGK